MFDSFLVRKDSLENVYDESGKAVGFKFGVRLSNYRGIYISLVNDFYVNMDGEEFKTEEYTISINGKAPRTMEELIKYPFEHWDLQDEAILYVKKEGGLAPGMHSLDYLPSTMDAYGYQAHDEEWVKNPPKPGQGGGKQFRPCHFDLELQ